MSDASAKHVDVLKCVLQFAPSIIQAGENTYITQKINKNIIISYISNKHNYYTYTRLLISPLRVSATSPRLQSVEARCS